MTLKRKRSGGESKKEEEEEDERRILDMDIDAYAKRLAQRCKPKKDGDPVLHYISSFHLLVALNTMENPDDFLEKLGLENISRPVRPRTHLMMILNGKDHWSLLYIYVNEHGGAKAFHMDTLRPRHRQIAQDTIATMIENGILPERVGYNPLLRVFGQKSDWECGYTTSKGVHIVRSLYRKDCITPITFEEIVEEFSTSMNLYEKELYPEE